MLKQGQTVLDFSRWQDKVNWQELATDNISGVIIKASQGVNGTDKKTRSHAEGAYSVGIPVGYYHFASLNDKDEVGDATKEANFFASIVKSMPSPQLGVWLDLEDNTAKLTPDEMLTWIKTFFAEMNKLGFAEVGLYSGKYFLDPQLPKNHGLGHVKLWLAQYVAKMKLPNGWTEAYLWQKTDKFKVKGISSGVDMSVVLKEF